MKIRSSLRATGTAPISLFAFQDIIFAATGIFLFVAIMMTLFGKIDLIATEALDETQTLREELNALAERMTITEHKAKIIESGAVINGDSTTAQEANKNDQTDFANVWLYDLEELFKGNEGLRKETDKLYQNLTSIIMDMNRRELRLELLQSGAHERLKSDNFAIIREGAAHDFREPVFLVIDSKGYSIVFPGRPELAHKIGTLDELRKYIDASFKPNTQSFLIHLKPSGITHFEKTKDMIQELGFGIGYEPILEDFEF